MKKDEAVLSPLEQAEREAREAARGWSRPVFRVNRALYRGQEALCRVVEAVVWVIYE